MEESKYLEFKIVGGTGKTVTVNVLSKLHGFKLGTVKWYSTWRQYCFFPATKTIFNRNCLREVADYVSELTNSHLENLEFNKVLSDNVKEVKRWPKWKRDITISSESASTGKFTRKNEKTG